MSYKNRVFGESLSAILGIIGYGKMKFESDKI
jgi:hypothetical protein